MLQMYLKLLCTDYNKIVLIKLQCFCELFRSVPSTLWGPVVNNQNHVQRFLLKNHITYASGAHINLQV